MSRTQKPTRILPLKRIRTRKAVGRFDSRGRRLLLKILEKITQEDVAKKIGCKQANVSYWKLGDARPNTRYAALFEEHFNIPVSSWFEPIKRASRAA